MEKILKSILQTEQEAEKILADAKLEAQKISQETAESLRRLQAEGEKETRRMVEAYLAKVREEATQAKEKILADAARQAKELERQAQDNMSLAVAAALDRFLPKA